MKLVLLQKNKNDTARDVRILVHHNIHRQRNKLYFYIKTMSSQTSKDNNTDDAHISAKRARRPIIHDLAHQIKSAQKTNAFFNGAETIIIKATLVYPWLTRDMVYGYLRRMKAKEAKINQGEGEYCHENLASVEATIPVEITNQNEGIHFDKNLESVEELSAKTNIEYEQQINDLSSKTDKLDIAFVTSKQIKYFIEQMVLKGAERRRNNPGIDEEWFGVERQCLVRKQVSEINCHGPRKRQV